MATSRIGAGFRYIFYGVVNSDGFVIGNTASGATAGAAAGEPMLRLEGADTAPVGIPEDERTPVSGDDSPQVEFKWDAADLPSGIITTSTRNLDFEALAQGTLVESFADLNVGVLQPSGGEDAVMCLLFQRRAKTWDPANRGNKAWEILVAPRSEVTPLGGNWAQRTHNPYNYAVTLSKSDKNMWGASFTEAVNLTTSAPLIPIFSDNPIFQDNYQGDGATTDFTLTHAPVSNAKTVVLENGVVQTITTDYTLTGTALAFVAAPASGVRVNVVYETSEANLG
jgi:hypothetical protein